MCVCVDPQTIDETRLNINQCDQEIATLNLHILHLLGSGFVILYYSDRPHVPECRRKFSFLFHLFAVNTQKCAMLACKLLNTKPLPIYRSD